MTQTIINTSLTPTVIKSKLSLELTKAGVTIQTLNDIESGLVYNEDNLQKIADFINQVKKAENLIETKRKELKEPSVIEGKNIDAGAKIISNELAEIKKKAHTRYTKLCEELQQKMAKADQDAKQKLNWATLVNNTIMEFSEKIGSAKTNEELIALERLLNLETANERKYGMELPNVKLRAIAIRSLLAAQKSNVKSFEALGQKEAIAVQNGDDLALNDVLEQKEIIASEIYQTSVKVQEMATEQSQEVRQESITQILPEVKVKRTLKKWEVINIYEAFKRNPEYVELIPNKAKIDEKLKEKYIQDALEKSGEHIENGIRFYIEKIY